MDGEVLVADKGTLAKVDWFDLGRLKLARDNAGLIFTRPSPPEFLVPAPSKRRLSIFSLPLVVATGFLLVAKLALWQRADFIAELAHCIAHGDTSEATAAVRQLGAMPRPPLSVLVMAAASDDHKIAHESQRAISRLMRHCERQLDVKQASGAVSRRLSELAQLLSEQHTKFPKADHTWLTVTTRKILRLANRCAPRKAPLVAMHCDEILSATGASGGETTPIVGEYETEIEREPASEATRPATAQSTRQALLERDIAAFDSDLDNENHGSGAETSVSNWPEDARKTAGALENAAASENETNDSAEKLAPISSEPVTPGSRVDEESQDAPSEALKERSWQSNWSHPILRILPTMPIHSPTMDRGELGATLPRLHTASPSIRLAAKQAETRDLLRDWLAVDGDAIHAIEQELAARGFERLSQKLVEQFFAPDAEVRRDLVNIVLTDPERDARPWLMLLSEDSDPDVRLEAVTTMATSSDPTLIEKAWQVAIGDRDPRIAGLAGRLRERRR
jgi:hypothetical protein